MLKYEINKTNLESDISQLPIIDYELHENNINEEYVDVILKYDTDVGVKINDKIQILIELTNPDLYVNNEIEYYDKEFNVADVDLTNDRIFLTIPAYINLNIISFEERNDVGNEKVFYWYIKFREKHFFKEDENIKLLIKYYKEGVIKKHTLTECVVIDDYTLRHKYKHSSHSVEGQDRYLRDCIFESKTEPKGYAKISKLGIAQRQHYLYTNKDTVSFFYKKYKLGVSIPIINTHDIDVTKQYSINEKFIEREKAKAINKPIEMEKNIFTPIYKYWRRGNQNNKINEKSEDVYKINFNLHLRQHHGNDWQTTDEDYWNGVIKNELGELTVDTDYFAKPYQDNISWQSDLISKIGFNDSDVKYQKSRLGKTFLRLSFYDSPDPGTQNLLSYATVFLDSNKLSRKYIKHQYREDYKRYDSINNNLKINLIGIRYNRDVNFVKDYDIDIDHSNCEDYRLSTQFSVVDRYFNNDCSEGFYLYLWKDLLNGTEPLDIYMKVELNHAGFGRVIPLMMPYFSEKIDDEWDGNLDNKKTWSIQKEDPIEENGENGKYYGIKSFYDIVNDWNNGGYTIKTYLNYTYIHLKCQFDKENNKYVYYLDQEFYENCNKIYDENTHTLNINLYEAKVSNSITTNTEPIKEQPYDLELDEIYYSDENDPLRTFQFTIKKEINDKTVKKHSISLNKITISKETPCDKDGYVYAVNENGEKYQLTDDKGKVKEYNGICYYTETNILCDENGYVNSVNENGEKYQLTDYNGNVKEYNCDYYYTEGNTPCDKDGYVYDINTKYILCVNETQNTQMIINEVYNKNKDCNEYYYQLDAGTKIECDKDGCFIPNEISSKMKKSKYKLYDIINENLHIFQKEDGSFYYKDITIKDDENNEYQLNKNKLIHKENYEVIIFKIKYNLNKECQLWDNYFKYDEYESIRFEDNIISNGDGCKLTIDFLDKNKDNCLSFKIEDISNDYYNDFLNINNRLNIVDFDIDVIYKEKKETNTETISWKYMQLKTEEPLKIERDLSGKTVDIDYEIMCNKQEFIFDETQPIPKSTTILFSLIDKNSGDILSIYDERYNIKYEVKSITPNTTVVPKNITDIMYITEESELELMENSWYITNKKIYEEITATEYNNNSIYNRKLEIKWNTSVDRTKWKNWKFFRITLQVIDTDDMDNETILAEKRFDFTFKANNDDTFYYIKSLWFNETDYESEPTDTNSYLKIKYDNEEATAKFIAYIIPFKKGDNINYNCEYKLPSPSEFDVKMIGVKSFDAPILEENIFKIKCALEPQYCHCCEVVGLNENGYKGKYIGVWIKSLRFETVTTNIYQNVKFVGYKTTEDEQIETATIFEFSKEMESLNNLTFQSYYDFDNKNTQTEVNYADIIFRDTEENSGDKKSPTYEINYSVLSGTKYLLFRTYRVFKYNTSSTVRINVNVDGNEGYFNYTTGYLFKNKNNWSFGCIQLTPTGTPLPIGSSITFKVTQDEKCDLLDKIITIKIVN